ncbi:YybH family protein [Nevskia soli]|uniref:YybH family protein n=1 Tax=Nevskia soli TaxID=418856 RepID=UPI0004A75CB9|nr:nuclear transport factor 2 family protein [Nevskia soli]
MNSPEDSVLQVIEAYKAAVLEKDVDAFMRLYDQKVRVFDMWGVWSYEGAAAWRKMIETWFGSLGSELVKVSMDDVQATAGRELAMVSAIVTYAGVSAEGEELRAMQNRLTWVLKPEGGAWKIVHEHTSAPVGFDDSKAILRCEKTF